METSKRDTDFALLLNGLCLERDESGLHWASIAYHIRTPVSTPGEHCVVERMKLKKICGAWLQRNDQIELLYSLAKGSHWHSCSRLFPACKPPKMWKTLHVHCLQLVLRIRLCHKVHGHDDYFFTVYRSAVTDTTMMAKQNMIANTDLRSLFIVWYHNNIILWSISMNF